MNWKMLLVLCVAVGLLIMGCASSQPPTGYYSYEGGAQPQGGQYVGGGCGLAGASGDSADMSSVAAAA
jgi:hypothetical protein